MKRIFLGLISMVMLTASASDLVTSDGWSITTRDRSDNYAGATMANGGIGLLVWREPFRIPHVMLNHVFDERPTEQVSRVLRGINPFGLEMKINGKKVEWETIDGWQQTLDMRDAKTTTTFSTTDGSAMITYTVRALRNMPYCGLIDVSVKAIKGIDLDVRSFIDVPDGEYREPSQFEMYTKIHGRKVRAYRKSAPSRVRGHVIAGASGFYFPDIEGVTEEVRDFDNAFKVRVNAGQTFNFALAGSVIADREFPDSPSESIRQVYNIISEGTDRMVERHNALWDELWQGDIVIEGDDDAQLLARNALFALYSFCREGSRLSISPFGLSQQGYDGHVFWDTETWMYPPMLFMNEGIARSMMAYRIDRLPQACRRAAAYGYRGAKFPWESDSWGDESCPTSGMMGFSELHITSDIGLGAWNFYNMTRDKEWLRSEGYPLISAAADFWVSRAEPNDDGTYSVRNVVCADEFAEGVNDNAFTNGGAKRVLDAATKAARILGEKADPRWAKVAKGLRILQFPDGTTREYDGYDGQQIKQADANLLAYPLQIVTDPEAIRRDLEYYEPRIWPGGPAMSYAILGVQYARLGDGDKALQLFEKAYKPHQRAPFGLITEGAWDGGNVYFATGAGGFLQCLINGFGGLEITEKGVKQLPSAIPSRWKRIEIKGVGPKQKTYIRENKHK